MGDFGEMGFGVDFNKLLEEGKKYIANPTNQEMLLKQGMKVIASATKKKKKKPASAAPIPQPVFVPAPVAPKSNTLLYVGIGFAALVVGGVILLKKKQKQK